MSTTNSALRQCLLERLEISCACKAQLWKYSGYGFNKEEVFQQPLQLQSGREGTLHLTQISFYHLSGTLYPQEISCTRKL